LLAANEGPGTTHKHPMTKALR